MIRVVLTNLALLLLPFILFAIYAWLTNRRARKGGMWVDAPLTILSLLGVVLVASMVVYFISFEGAAPGGTYTPPSFQDGKLQPGHIDQP